MPQALRRPRRSRPGGAASSWSATARNLWFLDRDLEQVTVKPVDAALSATPAMLLSGTVDVRKNFNISPAGQRDGARLGAGRARRRARPTFAARCSASSTATCKRMILEDKLGQTATIIFDKVERNGPVTPAEVSFTPPAGADVIGTPRK